MKIIKLSLIISLIVAAVVAAMLFYQLITYPEGAVPIGSTVAITFLVVFVISFVVGAGKDSGCSYNSACYNSFFVRLI